MDELNDYLNRHEGTFLYDHYDDYYKCASIVYNTIKPYINDLKLSNDDLINLPSYDIFERINFANKYYEMFELDNPINDLIDKGIIDLVGDEYQNDDKIQRSFIPTIGGFCKSDGTTISVNNTGTIVDSFVIIHELSHYKNNSSQGLISREFLTESLAFSEELVMLDSIPSSQIEKNIALRGYLLTFYNDAVWLLKVLYFLRVYKQYNSIDRESCKKYYQRGMEYMLNLYNEDLELYIDALKKESLKAFSRHAEYVVAAIIAPTMMHRIRKDKGYMEKLQNVHELVKDEKLEDVLEYLDIDVNKIKIYSKNLMDLCEEAKNKKIIGKKK